MDSKDSVNAVTREGGSSAAAATEDDGVLSAASSLAKDASALFQSRKYAECVDLLHQLLEKTPDNVKVLHNIAIAEFFNEGCSNPHKLLDALIKVKKKCQDLAHVTGEQEDATSHAGNRSISVPKGNNDMAHQMPTLNGEYMVCTDEYDASLATLNLAIILFNLHRHSMVQSILEPLFQNIDCLDEGIGFHVCMLLLDVAIVTQDVSKFMDLVTYLIRTFDVGYMINCCDTGSMRQQRHLDLVSKYSSVSKSASISDDLNSEFPSTKSTSDDSISRTLSEETMEYETLLSALDLGGRKISRMSSFQSMDMKLNLPLYWVQLLLLTRSPEAAKKEVELAMNVSQLGDSSSALLLKSQLEYVRGNYAEAMKLLVASKNQTERSIIFNNYGCIFCQQGNHHTSGIFFQKALTSCSALRKVKPKSFTSFSQDKTSLIAYNCGLQYLVCGNPMLAARCFQKAGSVFHSRPLLWLRLAECCLMALGKGPVKSYEPVPHGPEVKVHVVGQGKWRYLAMNKELSRNGQMKPSERDGEMHCSDGKPKLSFSFARQCLLNALHLLSYSQPKNVKSGFPSKSNQKGSEQTDGPSPRYSNHGSTGGSDLKAASKQLMSSGLVNSNGDIKDQRVGTTVGPVTVPSLADYEEILKRESQIMMQAVLVDLAFVELELGNSLRALSAALSLLEAPGCFKMHAFLGHMYAAEALCYLNRPKEAAEHLAVYLSGGYKVELPYTREDIEQWQMERMDVEDLNMAFETKPDKANNALSLKPEEARGTLYVNLAAMFSMQGDLEQACRFASQASAIMPGSIEAILMAVYLDLKLGNKEEAVAKLKQHRHVTFEP